MLICKLKSKKAKGWFQVTHINVELHTLTYVDGYKKDLKPYAFTTTFMKHIKKIKLINNENSFIRKKAKQIEKDKIKIEKWWENIKKQYFDIEQEIEV